MDKLPAEVEVVPGSSRALRPAAIEPEVEEPLNPMCELVLRLAKLYAGVPQDIVVNPRRGERHEPE